jgi:hypothetical protein
MVKKLTGLEDNVSKSVGFLTLKRQLFDKLSGEIINI